MNEELRAFIREELQTPLRDEIAEAARRLAQHFGGIAVLFYGSNLRTGDLEGVLDFYVLTAVQDCRGWRTVATDWLWPDVSYHELQIGRHLLRAKVATMRIGTFENATRGSMLDTTIWTRFAQPSALAWANGPRVESRVVDAVSDAVATAGAFAAALGPAEGDANAYWQALFRETYRAELRVEPPGRESQILANHPGRYANLLPIAWFAGCVPYRQQGSIFQPKLATLAQRRLARAWRLRRRAGKALNLARLVKAAFSFEGAARYGLWKVERHTGIHIPLTPWRERHPLLSAPAVLWRVFRAASR